MGRRKKLQVIEEPKNNIEELAPENFASSSFAYNGDVLLKVKIKDKEILINKLNSGTPLLQRSFAKFIAGESMGNPDIPLFLDLREWTADEPPASESVVWTDSNSRSLLLKPVLLTNKAFNIGLNPSWPSSYSALLQGTILYSSLVAEIPEDSLNLYRYYLTSNIDPDTRTYNLLAWISVAAADLSVLLPGTLVTITWYLRLVNKGD